MIGNPALPAAHKAATISDAFLNPGGTRAKHENCGRRVGARSRDAAVRSSPIPRHRGLQDPRMGPGMASTSMIAFAATTRAGHGPCSIVRNPHCRFTLVGVADIGMPSGSRAMMATCSARAQHFRPLNDGRPQAGQQINCCGFLCRPTHWLLQRPSRRSPPLRNWALAIEGT